MMTANRPENPRCGGAAHVIAASLIIVVGCCVAVVTGADAQDTVKIGMLMPNTFPCDKRTTRTDKREDCEEYVEIIKKLKAALVGKLKHSSWDKIVDLKTREYFAWNLTDLEKIEDAKDFIADMRLSLLVRFTVNDLQSQENIWSYEINLHNVTDVPDGAEDWFTVGRFAEPIMGNIEPGKSITAGEPFAHKIWNEVQGLLGYKKIFVGCLVDGLSKRLVAPQYHLVKEAVESLINNFQTQLTNEMKMKYRSKTLIEAGGKVKYEFGSVEPEVWTQHCIAGTRHNEFEREMGRAFYYVEGKISKTKLRSWAASGLKYVRIGIMIRRGDLVGLHPNRDKKEGKTYATIELALDDILDRYEDVPQEAAVKIEDKWPDVVKDMNLRD